MSLKKQCEQVLKNVDHSSFDSVNGALEKILDLLGQYGADPYIGTAVSKAEELKEEARAMLQKEKEEIQKTAQENGISLTELGMNENNENNDENKMENEENKENDQPKQSTESKNPAPSNQQEQSSQEDQNAQTSKCCILI